MKKVALITGSTSGIGLGIAKHLASLGMDIALHGLGDKGVINLMVSEIKDLYSVRCKHYDADLKKYDEIIDMVKSAKEDFGSIDILVNNAGIQFVSPIENFPNDKWESIIQIDLIASFYTTKYALEYMRAVGWGRVINIASAHALVASPYKSAYVAAKHGILGFTKAVALECAQQNITVNAICPGYVNTPLVLNQIKDTAKARNISEDSVIKDVILAAQATKHFVEIPEVAHLVGFLCSDFAKSITGTNLSIDGGWTAS